MKRSFVAASSAVLMMLSMTPLFYGQSTSVTGQWLVVYEGKPETALLTLKQAGGAATGQWMSEKGATSKLKDGKLAGDTLTFSFVHDKSHFNATGHLTGDAMSLDLIELQKGGKTAEIHGKATRGGMQ
ncbi:hypothetical protein [Edaphobacter modestus]|uniref:Lipocalin-like protein n=1 Tax=Edaphobacter modestus TaxID=388466 RepID=A0A4Q7Z0E3_9BACT|nr:hypothetical protein [Edaphobacter modestus]RZU43620.1 hypothetical protein BDD14_5299 [Edaphobacter modestus]